MPNTVIEVSNLSKKFNIGKKPRNDTLRDAIVSVARGSQKFFTSPRKFISKHRSDEYWALKNVNFTVNKGEVFGIIGRNGSGKSTLLKILGGITSPTNGRAVLRGRVASLLEVGTGFHPELTGRENIYLNGAILGMKNSEINNKFGQIVAFAEIGKFLDTPVKHYSSGMYVRLAFAVAAHLDPEILLVDEVLAVGDFQFQKKSLGRMEDISSKEGRTILFVSHNLAAVRGLCHKAIWLDEGKIIRSGYVNDVVDDYEKSAENKVSTFLISSGIIKRNSNQLKAVNFYIGSVELLSGTGGGVNILKYNDKLVLTITIHGVADQTYSVEFYIYNELGQLVAVGASGAYHGIYFDKKTKKIKIEIGPLMLTSGKYSISSSLVYGIAGTVTERPDMWQNACTFEIIDCKPFATKWDIPATREGVFVIPQSFSGFD